MSAPAFAVVVAQVVADLIGAEVAATAESERVRLPGAWVGGVRAEPSRLGGEWDYQVDIYLVDQTTGDMRTYVALDELAGKVAALWPLAEDRQLEATVVNLPGQPAVPAYLYPITVTH